MIEAVWVQQLKKTAPTIHCLTNPVSMQDVANVLLAAGGSAIMGQDKTEVQEITAHCQATLLNLGVPDETKLCSGALAGMKANEAVELVLKRVNPSLIRCNQGEAYALLDLKNESFGGVESSVELETEAQLNLSDLLARVYGCTVMVSGKADAVSDGERRTLLTGGDPRIRRITGSGCMLSALCALFCGAGLAPFEAACAAGSIWKESAWLAGKKTDEMQGGIGSFHVHLFDAVDQLCHGRI